MDLIFYIIVMPTKKMLTRMALEMPAKVTLILMGTLYLMKLTAAHPLPMVINWTQTRMDSATHVTTTKTMMALLMLRTTAPWFPTYSRWILI